MLYIPASWFHEVFSTGSGAAGHMAINYWFIPPDQLNNSQQCYKKQSLWEHRWNRQKQLIQQEIHNMKQSNQNSSMLSSETVSKATAAVAINTVVVGNRAGHLPYHNIK